MMLNAVMCVWNEEDIIESTVRHAFAQGCSNVFIVDNSSTDSTVDTAIKAGAKLAATFKTEFFDEDQKVAHLNATVKHINDISPEEKIWWLYIDADEFPNFDSTFTIIDVLKQLDSSVRAVHGYLLNHIPTHHPYHVQGYHPADFQPLCSKTSTGKVPLLRYDKELPHLWSIGGAHDFITHRDIIPTIKDFINIHHFPCRNPEYTLVRSKILAQTRNTWYKNFLRQVHKSDLPAYEARYKQLRVTYDSNKHLALKSRALTYDFKNIVRWYDLHADKQFISSEYEKHICAAIYYYFIAEYDISLCRFNDALNVCDDAYIKIWIMLKIAECLSYTDFNDARNIIDSIKKYNNDELNLYINTYLDLAVKTQYKKESTDKDIKGKIEFYSSEFPDGIEEAYRKLTTKIEKNIFRAK